MADALYDVAIIGGGPAGSIAAASIMRGRLAGARRVTKVYASGDYSYRNAALCGERWLMAGDAAGFIDPIFSSGVFLAAVIARQMRLTRRSRSRIEHPNTLHSTNAVWQRS